MTMRILDECPRDLADRGSKKCIPIACESTIVVPNAPNRTCQVLFLYEPMQNWRPATCPSCGAVDPNLIPEPPPPEPAPEA